MMTQPSGWGSTQNAASLPAVDAFARNLLMKYGGRTDDIWAFHEMPGYRTSLQGAGFAGGNVANPFIRGTGTVSMRGVGGGNTPSNPGGENWGTFQNVVNSPAGMYKMYRGKKQQIAQKQKVADMQAARQQKQQAQQSQQSNQAQLAANTQAYNAAFNPDMQYGSIYQAGVAGMNPAQPAPPTFGQMTTPVGPTSNIKNPQNPVEAANKGLMEWKRQRMSSKFPNPVDPSEAANKGVADMLRAQQAKAESARLNSADLYRLNKSLRASFPNFYKNL